VLRSV